MPRRLAQETARLLAGCVFTDETRRTALHAFQTAAEYGFNHGNAEFLEALCDELKVIAGAETDPARQQCLHATIEIVCALAAELNASRRPVSDPE